MEDNFALLEEKVLKAAELVKRLRKENRALSEDSAKAKAAVQDAEKRLSALQKEKAASTEQVAVVSALRKELDELTRERSEVRSRVAKLVELLEGLD